MSKARPIMVHVPGAPCQAGSRVRFIGPLDEECDEIKRGETGTVVYLEYSCGCGQRHPGRPMVGVSFGGRVVEVWPREIVVEEEDEPVLVLDIGDNADWIRKVRLTKKGVKTCLTV